MVGAKASALGVALVVFCAGGARAGVIITFDLDAFGNVITAPCNFFQTTALRDLYAPLGVTFAGSGPNDGGAILDQCGNFGVPAFNGTNFLAFNRNAEMQDGGIATDPQIIIFDPAASVVSIWVAGGNQNGSFLMEAFDVNDMLVDSDSVVTQGYSQLSVSAQAIKRVVLTETSLDTDEYWVFDHLQFEVATSCFQVVNETTNCHADGSSFTYTVQGVNSCTGGMSTYSFTASGGAVGEEMCFTLVIVDDQGGLCCFNVLCVTIPDCTPAALPSDLDGDGIVGIVDFLALLAAWGSCSDCGTCPADFDGDCSVGILDLLILLGNWG